MPAGLLRAATELSSQAQVEHQPGIEAARPSLGCQQPGPLDVGAGRLALVGEAMQQVALV